MNIPIMLSARDIPFGKLDTYSGTRPQVAIIRELDFEVRGTELWIGFSGWNPDENVPDEAALETLVDYVCQPGYVFHHDEIPPDPPFGSALSLKVPGLRYVIYKLSDKSWQFARRGYPVTVGISSESRYFCFDAFRCSDSGYDDRDEGSPFEVPVAPRDDCKVAFFIVDGKTARDNEEDGTYDHAFNLHVDLIFAGNPIHRIPIMIDPDVRFPGGAGQ